MKQKNQINSGNISKPIMIRKSKLEEIMIPLKNAFDINYQLRFPDLYKLI